MSYSGSFFDSFSPKAAFIVGLGSSVGLIGFVGFIIMLVISLNGGTGGEVRAASSDSNNVAVGNTRPAPTPSGGTPSGAMGGHGGGAAPSALTVQPISDDDHVLGDRNARVSIVEFSDIQCPFCRRLHPTLEQVVAQYDGDVNWVYRHFPLDSIHPQANPAAQASECAAEQGKFWEFIDEAFERQTQLSAATYSSIAGSLGLDAQAFESCVASGKYNSKVRDHGSQAIAAQGRGTPYAVVVGPNGETIPFSGAVPVSQVQSIVDSLL